jgi:Na+/proline symporter
MWDILRKHWLCFAPLWALSFGWPIALSPFMVRRYYDEHPTYWVLAFVLFVTVSLCIMRLVWLRVCAAFVDYDAAGNVLKAVACAAPTLVAAVLGMIVGFVVVMLLGGV